MKTYTKEDPPKKGQWLEVSNNGRINWHFRRFDSLCDHRHYLLTDDEGLQWVHAREIEEHEPYALIVQNDEMLHQFNDDVTGKQLIQILNILYPEQ